MPRSYWTIWYYLLAAFSLITAFTPAPWGGGGGGG